MLCPPACQTVRSVAQLPMSLIFARLYSLFRNVVFYYLQFFKQADILRDIALRRLNSNDAPKRTTIPTRTQIRHRCKTLHLYLGSPSKNSDFNQINM